MSLKREAQDKFKFYHITDLYGYTIYLLAGTPTRLKV